MRLESGNAQEKASLTKQLIEPLLTLSASNSSKHFTSASKNKQIEVNNERLPT